MGAQHRENGSENGYGYLSAVIRDLFDFKGIDVQKLVLISFWGSHSDGTYSPQGIHR